MKGIKNVLGQKLNEPLLDYIEQREEYDAIIQRATDTALLWRKRNLGRDAPRKILQDYMSDEDYARYKEIIEDAAERRLKNETV